MEKESNALAGATSGAGFGDDALPFRDLAEGVRRPAFEVQADTVMLRGSRSRSSGSLAFPEREVCLKTGARDMEPVLFGPRGTLYSYSTVHVSSSRPTPYTIGYVDFPNGVRVLANIDVPSDMTDKLACDTTVELRAHGERWFVVPVGTQQGSE